MQVSMRPEITYTNRSEERKDTEKKVITGGGAAIVAGKKGVDRFTSATSKVSKGMKVTTEATKAVGEVAEKSKGLWAKAGKAARWCKDWILNGSSKYKSIKFLKPIIESKAFSLCAGGLGYAFGAVTLISGLSDIGKVVTDTAEKYTA